MSDQPLPLQLPIPSLLPGRIRPELSTPCQIAFDHPDFRFSVDWDGCRALLFAAEDGIRLQGATLRDISDRFPEVVSAATDLAERRAILDGVVTVLDPAGCPDLVALGERQAAGPGFRQKLPAVFLATDILHLDGRTTLSLPLDTRLKLLSDLALGDGRIQTPDWVAGQGEAFADAALSRNLAALLARRAGSAYHPGIASPDRLRISLSDRLDLSVVGAEPVAGLRRRRLRLAEESEGRMHEVADVEIAASSSLWRAAAPGGHLRSGIVATVVHQGRTGEGRLRLPSLVTLRDDVDPMWCRLRAPVLPPVSTTGHIPGGFRPTILTALPLDR